MGLKDTILAANDIPSETVDIPEWGVKVQCRGLDVSTYTGLQRAARTDVTPGGDAQVDMRLFYCLLVVGGVYDPDTGAPVFTEADIPALGEKAMHPIDRLTKVINRLSGMGEDGDPEKAVIEQGKGSSEATISSAATP